MDKKIMKNIRMSKATSTALNVLAAQNGLTIGALLAALVKFQAAGKYITQSEEQDRFKNMWDQAVLSTKRAGHSGWTGKNEEPGVVVIIDENTNAE